SDDRMEGLHDEGTARSKEFWCRADQRVDRVFANECKVGDGDIDRERKLAARDRLVGCDVELTAAGRPRLIHERTNDIHPDHSRDASRMELANEPAFTAPDIEHGLGS